MQFSARMRPGANSLTGLGVSARLRFCHWVQTPGFNPPKLLFACSEGDDDYPHLSIRDAWPKVLWESCGSVTPGKEKPRFFFGRNHEATQQHPKVKPDPPQLPGAATDT